MRMGLAEREEFHFRWLEAWSWNEVGRVICVIRDQYRELRRKKGGI